MRFSRHVAMAMRALRVPLAVALFSLVPLLACTSSDEPLGGVGTVELTETDVAPMYAARVTRVWVDEGDSVQAGDTLVSLTQAALGADRDARAARLNAAEAQLRELEAGARAPELARASAELDAAEATAARTQRDVERLAPLAAQQNISAQQFDAARAAAREAAGRRDALREQLRLLREGTRPERIAAARAEVAAARAALAGAQATANELVLTAATPGVILSRHAEPGTLLAPGQSALTMGDPTKTWVRVYLDQAALPRVHVGDPATALLDAFPNKPFAGRVVSINQTAEYTPRVALTEEERADLLFGVKIALADSSGMLKAGLPVTVRLQGRPPASAR